MPIMWMWYSLQAAISCSGMYIAMSSVLADSLRLCWNAVLDCPFTPLESFQLIGGSYWSGPPLGGGFLTGNWPSA